MATRNKYGAKKVQEDGYVFDSQRESRRYAELRTLHKCKEIADLQVHPRYPITVQGVKVCTYEADFSYTEKGSLIVEDVKGVKTPVYRLKKKLMKALYGLDIVEIA